MHSPVVLVLFCSVGLVASQCNHDHDHGEHDHSSLPQGPVRPKTNAPDVPKGPYTSGCKGCSVKDGLVVCTSCKSVVFESNYEELKIDSKTCDGDSIIVYTLDKEDATGKLECDHTACINGIHIAGNSWLSGTYMMQAGDAEWAGGVDGAPVYGKKSGKSLLYLFKRGSTWRVGRKPGAQNVIAVLQEGDTLLSESPKWSLYDSKAKAWVEIASLGGTCRDNT
eukprot:gene3054-27772_t